jgi:1-acyl-sn-glycerol-3-phosphate acyltransferase
LERLELTDGIYRTPERGVSFFSKALPSLVGSWRILRCVFWASGMSKRGLLGDEEWSRSCMGVIRALESVGVSFEITGMENMDSVEGPCVFVANHMSTLETFCLPAMILPHGSLTFVVKKSLTEYPVFRHIMRATQAIPVTRENPREDLKAVLEGGARRLGEGMSIVIFPQTTRSTEFRPEEFNSLGIKLARRAGVPVVPIALKTDAWGVGKFFFKDFGKIDPSKKVYFSFGRPITISGKGDEEHQEVMRFIGSRLSEWRG